MVGNVLLDVSFFKSVIVDICLGEILHPPPEKTSGYYIKSVRKNTLYSNILIGMYTFIFVIYLNFLFIYKSYLLRPSISATSSVLPGSRADCDYLQ